MLNKLLAGQTNGRFPDNKKASQALAFLFRQTLGLRGFASRSPVTARPESRLLLQSLLHGLLDFRRHGRLERYDFLPVVQDLNLGP